MRVEVPKSQSLIFVGLLVHAGLYGGKDKMKERSRNGLKS